MPENPEDLLPAQNDRYLSDRATGLKLLNEAAQFPGFRVSAIGRTLVNETGTAILLETGATILLAEVTQRVEGDGGTQGRWVYISGGLWVEVPSG